jgi:hypothetical protein
MRRALFPDETVNSVVRTVLLEKFEIQFSRKIHPSIIEQARFNIQKEALTGDILYQFSTFMAGDTLEDVHIEYPLDWKQSFKERWFPKWYLRRWPTRMKHIHITARAFYPKIQLQDDPHFVKVDRIEYNTKKRV